MSIARKLPSQFPAIFVRRADTTLEMNSRLVDFARVVEDFRKELVKIANDHANILNAEVLKFTPLTRGAGSEQPAIEESGSFFTTDGDFTIPAQTGWNCWLELGGDHDLVFDGGTFDTGTGVAGDVFKIMVLSSTTIRLLRFAAADVVDQGDFV